MTLCKKERVSPFSLGILIDNTVQCKCHIKVAYTDKYIMNYCKKTSMRLRNLLIVTS